MQVFQNKSLAEQVADHLKKAIIVGELKGEVPGAKRLAEEMGVSHLNLQAAFKMLEGQGYLKSHGLGKSRTTFIPKRKRKRTVKICFLKYDPYHHMDRVCMEAVHHLRERGHTIIFADKSQKDLGMDVRRIARYVEKTEADAWIVGSAKQSTLEWFSNYKLPSYAFLGQSTGVDIAGFILYRSKANAEAAEKLIELGHRKIVIIGAGGSRPAGPLESEKAFLKALDDHGIPTSSYNIPEWENTMEGYQALLERLFRHTPPTAMIFEESIHYYAAEQFCARRNMMIPRDISMVCADLSPALYFSNPPVTHQYHDVRKLTRHICNWADKLAMGGQDHHKMKAQATFVEGGTIAAVPVRVG